MKLTLRILFCAALLPFIAYSVVVVLFIGVSFTDWSIQWSFLDLSTWKADSRLGLLMMSVIVWFFVVAALSLNWVESNEKY